MLLIDAGVTSLVEAPHDILERGLRSEQVVNQAGASQATFFRKFRTKSEFIEAVITSLTESTLHSADKVKQTVRAQLAANDDALRPNGHHSRSKRHSTQSSTTRRLQEAFSRTFLRLTPANLHRSGNRISSTRRARVRCLRGPFEKTDATLRRPFTTKTFAVTVNAVIDGFRIRSRIDSRLHLTRHDVRPAARHVGRRRRYVWPFTNTSMTLSVPSTSPLSHVRCRVIRERRFSRGP